MEEQEHYRTVRCPSHYEWMEVQLGIAPHKIAETLGFNLGNAFKYIVRAGRKSYADHSHAESAIIDLEKAREFISYEINRYKQCNND